MKMRKEATFLVLIFVSQLFLQQQVLASSPVATIGGTCNTLPQQVHISLAGDGYVRISWISTYKMATSVVEYGTKAGSYNEYILGDNFSYHYYSYVSGKIHYVTIGPLAPSTTYYYRVGGTGSELSFRTPPASFPAEFVLVEMEEVSSNPTEGFEEPSSQPKEATIGTRRQSTKNVAPKINVEMVEDDDDEEVIVLGVNGRKLTSVVWKDFEQIKVDGEVKARCKGCKNVFVGGGRNGTTHLKDHIKRCFKLKNTMDVRQQLLQASKSKSSSGTPNLEMKSSKFKFNAQVSRGELVNAVILHEYPLAIVDHVGFRRYSGSLNPEFKVPTRNTVKSDILRQFKEERAKKMRELAENESRVAITTDLWTCSNQRKGYMAVTAHYIDNDWVLRDEIIRFIYVPCPHNKESLSKALVECLKSFNLDEKVSSITLDNCTTNDAVVDVLREKLHSSKLILGGAFLHMRCCAHILNLVVGDGLEYIKDAIEKVRSVVSFCIATPKRYEKFEDACNYCKIPITKKLVLDCKTRWNSCYDMLNVAIMYKDAFTRLDSKVGKRGKDKFQLPSKEEWRMASLICERLALFQRATEAFSGRNYPTANLYFVKVCEINLALRKWSHCGNKVIEEMASKMKDKFDKYWSVINAMLSVASVLDPRKKLECVSFYYRLVYGDSSEVEVDRVKRLLVELVSDYEKVECDDVTPNLVPSSFTNVNNKRPMGEIEDCEGLWERFCLEQPPKKTKKCEVESYLGENRITSDDSKFNLLAWWKHQSHNYPTLSKIVRDILAVPISTVASESAFSTSGRIIGPHRSRLLPDTIEALMCLQSWRRLEFKGEKKNYLECASIYDDEDVELEGHE